MKRIVYPIFEKCEPLTKAIELDDRKYKLEIDLKNAFHQGYIDRHGVMPSHGRNPFLDEYENLLTDSDELRFKSPGIGSDKEAKIGESAKLGRSFARGILSEHLNYSWFASIQNLKVKLENGWAAEKKNNGDSPDWLVGSNLDFAIAEAKGAHSKISLTSQKVEDWRTQVQNITIKHHGVNKSLKTWILATRFVTEDQKTELPEFLLEDPPLDGEELNSNDTPSLIRWISKTHIISNLERLGQFPLALRIEEDGYEKRKTKVLVWQCIHPKLQHLRFIGRNIDFKYFAYLPLYWMEEFIFSSKPRRFVERFAEWHSFFGNTGFFDGMSIQPIQQLLGNGIPESIFVKEFDLSSYSYLSLLNDGSFIAPMNLMRPVDIKEL